MQSTVAISIVTLFLGTNFYTYRFYVILVRHNKYNIELQILVFSLNIVFYILTTILMAVKLKAK
jgi:hypothetical protein